MDRTHKVIFIVVISITTVSWIFARDQSHMMGAIMYEPSEISLFSINWMVGMAAMMLPSILPVIFFYNSMIRKARGGRSYKVVCFILGRLNGEDSIFSTKFNHRILLASYVFLNIIFVGSYLLIWTLIGIAFMLIWSIPANSSLAHFEARQQFQAVYGIIFIISGVYQLSPLKRTCLKYCECRNFFLKKWIPGVTGTLRMGICHGFGCVGNCWPYCLLMISLGWMNLIWMGLFAGIIFAEKIWLRGLWVARTSGVVLIAVGIIAILGLIVIPNYMIM